MALLLLAASSKGETKFRIYDVEEVLQHEVGLVSPEVQMRLFQNSLPTIVDDGSAHRWWVTQVDSRTGPSAPALFADLLRVLSVQCVAAVRADLGLWISEAAQLPASRAEAQAWEGLGQLGYFREAPL